MLGCANSENYVWRVDPHVPAFGNCGGLRVGSVLGNLGVDSLRPGIDAAGQVVDLCEPRLAEEVSSLGAASAHLAVDDDLPAGVELADPLWQVIQRDQVAANVADLVLVRLTHIEHKEVIAPVKALLEFFNGDIGHRCWRGGFLSTDPAELIVVDQFRHRRMRSADEAIGILA